MYIQMCELKNSIIFTIILIIFTTIYITAINFIIKITPVEERR